MAYMCCPMIHNHYEHALKRRPITGSDPSHYSYCNLAKHKSTPEYLSQTIKAAFMPRIYQNAFSD